MSIINPGIIPAEFNLVIIESMLKSQIVLCWKIHYLEDSNIFQLHSYLSNILNFLTSGFFHSIHKFSKKCNLKTIKGKKYVGNNDHRINRGLNIS